VASMLTISLILASACRAQDTSSLSTSSSENSSDESVNSGDAPQSLDTAYPVLIPVAPGGRLGSPLSTVAGKVLVGNIALRSVALDEIWNQANIVNAIPATASSVAPTFTTGLEANIGYDRQFRTAHLSLQYAPSIYFFDGHLLKNIANENTNLNLSFQLTPRLFLTIGDTFFYTGAQNLSVGQYFTADLVTQTVNQNAFLNIAGSYLNDGASLTLSYNLTARTTLSVTPSYTYSYSRTTVNPNSAPAAAQLMISKASAGTVSLNHQITDRKGIGLYYSYDRSYFNQTFGTSYFNTAGLQYSQLVQPTLWLSASVGASLSNSTAYRGRSAATAVGSLSLIKTYAKTQLSAAYSRSYGSNIGFISPSYTDRVDMGYSRQITQNWAAGASGAYLRSTIITSFTGSYASLNTSYQLTRTISWFAQYGLDQEFGVRTPFYPGTHMFGMTGLRWNASRIHIGNEQP
jgi:hypothetical protein